MNKVTLERDARVGGNVTVPNPAKDLQLKTGATIGGSVLAGLVTPTGYAPVSLPSPRAFATNSHNDISTNEGAALVLPPGSYGDLNLARDNVLHLSSGAYYFDRITADRDLDLRLNLGGGAIDIFVAGKVNVGQNLDVFVNSVSYTQANSQLADRVYLEAHGSVQLDLDAQWFGTMYTPNEKLSVGRDSSFTGALYSGDRVEIDRNGNGAFVRSHRFVAPTITAQLVTDTGISSTDRITSQFVVAGTVSDPNGVASLRLSIDNPNPASFVNAPFNLANGSFVIDRALLNSLGIPLPDGSHTLRLIAADSAGNVSAPFELSFMLDTTAPSPLTLELAPDFDSPPLGDQQTIFEQVTLVGQTEPNLDVSLQSPVINTAADALGQFQFASVPLAFGPNQFTVVATDLAGNTRTFSQTITRLASETDPPVITVGLANDTAPGGTTNSDGITFDPAVAGQVTDASSIGSFRIGRDDMPIAAYAQAVDHLQGDGHFALNRSQLELLLGTLSDGPHALHFQATDVLGNTSGVVTVQLVLDTAILTPTLDLAVGSDTTPVGDRATNSARVTLVGLSDSHAGLTLNGNAATSLANAGGMFQFPDVSLSLGDNLFVVQATDSAGNQASSQVVIRRDASPSHADPVLRWNAAALTAVRLDSTPPPVATRNLAMVSVAVFDVVSAIEGTPGYFVHLAPPVGISLSAAVSGAAHRVLEYSYPGQAAAFNAVLADVLSSMPEGPAETNGLAYGQQVADAIIAQRAGDGWDTFVDFVPSSGSGNWQFTPPMYAVALLPQWGYVQPFAMSDVSQFLPLGPPSLDSEEWADAFNQALAGQSGHLVVNNLTVNSGNLLVTSGGTLTVAGGTWDDTGLLRADAGTINLGGTSTRLAGSRIELAGGGRVDVNGVLQNAGRTLMVDTTNGMFRLVGGRINGGTVAGPSDPGYQTLNSSRSCHLLKCRQLTTGIVECLLSS